MTLIQRLIAVALIGIAIAGPVEAQSPLNPAGWSDLYTQSRGVGYWINGARLCGIKYDQEKLDAQIAQIAEVFDLSVKKLKQEGELRAAEFVPYVTAETCRGARAEAKRMKLL